MPAGLCALASLALGFCSAGPSAAGRDRPMISLTSDGMVLRPGCGLEATPESGRHCLRKPCFSFQRSAMRQGWVAAPSARLLPFYKKDFRTWYDALTVPRPGAIVCSLLARPIAQPKTVRLFVQRASSVRPQRPTPTPGTSNKSVARISSIMGRKVHYCGPTARSRLPRAL